MFLVLTNCNRQLSGAVSQPQRNMVVGLIPRPEAVLCGALHVLPVPAWVLSGFSSFLPQFTDMHTGDSKLPVGVRLTNHVVN